jgi:hypothetical protein
MELFRIELQHDINNARLVVWGIAPCVLVEVDRRFRGTYYLHHHGNVGGSMHLRNVGLLKRDFTDLYFRRLFSSDSLP